MPLTIADAAALSRNMLLKGVIETIITESAVLRHLPFVNVEGNSLKYNQEVSPGTVQFYAVGDTWNEDAMDTTEKTANLKILGGDADVDMFLQQTYGDTNNLKALVIEKKAKAIAYAFNDAFFNGDDSVDVNSFDGLQVLSAGSRTMTKGANGATLALDHMDELIDMVKPGKPDVLFCSKRTRRKLSSLRRASGNLLEVGVDQFGRRATFYDGIPLEVDDNISDVEEKGTSSDCSSIYAVKFGFQTGLCGLQNGPITVVPIGNLETKDAWRTRIKWYVSLALFRDVALARLEGVRD
ncbi:MAG: major capsid protein [Chloroflexota bacterium]